MHFQQVYGKNLCPVFYHKKLSTGLGSSISESIIEDHKGSSLSLKSKEGKGTTCEVTMPIYQPAMKEQNN